MEGRVNSGAMFNRWSGWAIGLLLSGCASLMPSGGPGAEVQSQRHLHHVAVVWLKPPADERVKQQYIEASRAFAGLPGVLNYQIGVPAQIKRSRTSAALDESYDIAVSAVYESQEAFEAFIKHPEYQRVAQQILRPLVDRYKVYDFVE